jgi:ankyrin repeat protein
MAEWMLEHGSDVHQGGDGPLMRAALNGYRIPMMELLVSHGADVNALWHGHFPIIFAPCESMDAAALKWLLDHGANPNCRDGSYEISGHPYPGTALDYVIAGYARSLERLSACIDVLLEAGGETRYNTSAVLAVLRGRLDSLAELIDAEPGLVNRRFSELDCGQTGGRALLLQGGTLLHVAAEYGNVEAVALLLDRGADVNARATVDKAGIGGQTAVFHAVTQFDDGSLPITQLLVERGADLTVRVKLPGKYERPGDTVECTALGYALLFGGERQRRTVALLREWRAVE